MPLRGHRLRELRRKLGYTQEDLAERLNVNIRQIHRYETGESDPLADVVARMASIFQVSTDYLLGLTDDPTAELTEEDLTPMERKVIMAVRQGLIVEAYQTLATFHKRED